MSPRRHGRLELRLQDKDYRALAESLRDQAAAWYKAHPEAYRRDLKSLTLEKLQIYESIRERRPFRNTTATLKTTACITKRALSDALRSHYPIADRVAIAAYCIELGGHSFFEARSFKRLVNLAGAKNSGYFFTPPSVARAMVLRALDLHGQPLIALDPACGSGIFLGFLAIARPTVPALIGIELDEFTAHLARKVLRQVLREIGSDAKLLVRTADFLDAKPCTADLILMNPPYGRVRFIAPNLTNRETIHGLSRLKATELRRALRARTLTAAARLRALADGKYPEKGIPDRSRLFIRKALAALSNEGLLVTITSSAWLADRSAGPLRRLILDNHGMSELWTFPENAGLFTTVNQPTAVVFLHGRRQPRDIAYRPLLKTAGESASTYEPLPIAYLQYKAEDARIPQRGGARLGILETLSKFPPLRTHSGVLNRRGELDLTIHKKAVTDRPTSIRLVRGDHIREFVLLDPDGSEKDGYVLPGRFSLLAGENGKGLHIASKRIAVPQCSYLKKRKRLQAAIVPEGSVLANSCNYLLVESQKDAGCRLHYYGAVLNSIVAEWYFCLFNSNNHIANYELDEIPVPGTPSAASLDRIDDYYRQCELDPWGSSRLTLEATILRLYRLDEAQVHLLIGDLIGKIAAATLEQLFATYQAMSH